MNETIFLTHVVIIVAFTLGALRHSKEALISLVAIQAVIANLFVIKQTHLFGLEVTCCDVYIVGSMLGINLIQEFHGSKAAAKAITIAFAAMLFCGLVSQLQLLYSPSFYDTAHTAYETLLGPAPRITLSSFVSYVLAQLVNITLFRTLEGRRGGSTVALLAGQLVDTVAYTVLALGGIVHSLMSVIIVSYTIKAISILAFTPVTLIARRVYRPSPTV